MPGPVPGTGASAPGNQAGFVTANYGDVVDDLGAGPAPEDVVEADGSGTACFAMDGCLVTGDAPDEMLHRGAYAENGS